MLNANNSELVICISEASLMCPLCLSSYLDLFKELSNMDTAIHQKGFYLVRLKKRADTQRKLKIKKLQLNGFIKSNNISFPIEICHDGTYGQNSYIYIYHNDKIRRKWELPLTIKNEKKLFLYLNRLSSNNLSSSNKWNS
ncbi:hypothetical protein KAR48_18735 [bacterium]|nr:hypothetical protein [bacterium]